MALLLCGSTAAAQDYFGAERARWLAKAAQNTPELSETLYRPVAVVEPLANPDAYQGWAMADRGPAQAFLDAPFGNSSGVILDFGEHLTGYVSIELAAVNKTPDSPARLRLTFGEAPSEMAVPLDPYPGTLSRAWLQDETVTITTVPGVVEIPRRVAFRYVKIEVVAAPSYDFRISDIRCRALTSAKTPPAPLPADVPQEIRTIEEVALRTLRECMQTVYEDGPKRDRRLWIGDLYLESLGNNYSFRQFDLTRRCLYLVAGICGAEGFLHANAFEEPEPHPEANQYLYEYALLFNATLKDYLMASGDRETAQELWPVAQRQLDIVRRYLGGDMLDFDRLQREWWVFMDWKEGLYKETAAQGVAIFALRETLELARMLGREAEIADVPGLIERMTRAVRKKYYDSASGVFRAPSDPQVSYASQIWMALSGVATQKQGQKALAQLERLPDVCTPGTPYLYHYYIQALVDCGLHDEARRKLTEYWGGMVRKGADTFWEAYDPQDDFISPYNFYPVNSYCHAWSCTPVYFIRKYPEIFQR